MVEVHGVSTDRLNLAGETVVNRDDDRFGTQMRHSGISEAKQVELVSLDQRSCGPIDLDSAAYEVFQLFHEGRSLPGRCLIDEVAGFGEDVRHGQKLSIWLKDLPKKFNILICEDLDALELMQECGIRSGDEPK